MPETDENAPPVNIPVKTQPDEANGEAAPASGTEAETIRPPEQPPMDDAAGGPQAEDPNAPVEMPGENPGHGSEPQIPTENGEDAARSESQPS